MPRTVARAASDVIDHDVRMSGQRPAPLRPILVLSFLATFGTAILWNGLAFIAKEAYGFDESWNLGLAIFNGNVQLTQTNVYNNTAGDVSVAP